MMPLNTMIPLTDKELEECGLGAKFKGFALWDEDGFLVTVHMHKKAIEKLIPKEEP
jgi:hypothetical protein